MSLRRHQLLPVGFHWGGQLHRLLFQLQLLVRLRVLDSLSDEVLPDGLLVVLHVPRLHPAPRHPGWLGDGRLARRHAELEARGASPEVGPLRLPSGLRGGICRERKCVRCEFAAVFQHMPRIAV